MSSPRDRRSALRSYLACFGLCLFFLVAAIVFVSRSSHVWEYRPSGPTAGGTDAAGVAAPFRTARGE